MPELPEVETVRRDLEHLTLGEQITRVNVFLERTIASPETSEFCHCLVGCQFQSWLRRGKYLLARFQNQSLLGIHLRMTGQLLWLTEPYPPSPHTRVRLALLSGAELRFEDQRTFGRMWLVPGGVPPEQVISALGKLGPEPFSSEFSVDHLQIRFRRSPRPIKNALLDQQVVAGVGNIYADETLFLSHLHPLTPSHWLQGQDLRYLRENLIQVLQTSIEHRGTTIRSYRDTRGVNGNYQGQAWVYGREGQPCRRCGCKIRRIKLAGRSAHFCPQCQPPPPERSSTPPL